MKTRNEIFDESDSRFPNRDPRHRAMKIGFEIGAKWAADLDHESTAEEINAEAVEQFPYDDTSSEQLTGSWSREGFRIGATWSGAS